MYTYSLTFRFMPIQDGCPSKTILPNITVAITQLFIRFGVAVAESDLQHVLWW